MTRKQALRLKPGDRVLCADHWRGDKVRDTFWGRVKRITARGGILVDNLRDGGFEWWPYHKCWYENGLEGR